MKCTGERLMLKIASQVDEFAVTIEHNTIQFYCLLAFRSESGLISWPVWHEIKGRQADAEDCQPG